MVEEAVEHTSGRRWWRLTGAVLLASSIAAGLYWLEESAGPPLYILAAIAGFCFGVVTALTRGQWERRDRSPALQWLVISSWVLIIAIPNWLGFGLQAVALGGAGAAALLLTESVKELAEASAKN